jgi:2-dehydro-3-deoxyphosphogluconate aldolase/(4S)-4-hydroxy-2-oxoglutarate aldolase
VDLLRPVVEQRPENILDFEAFISELRVVPVVAIPSVEAAVPLARALAAGGLPCAEITFRTPAAAEAITAIAHEVPEVVVGAGTILDTTQAEEALRAGARFIVAPGFGSDVVDFCLDRGVPVVPGVCTPTEVTLALARGLTILKLFPAEALGGIGYLKALAAPFREARFVPTGGVDSGNLASYLEFSQVIACGGTWMVKQDLISAGAFETIRHLAADACTIAERVRPRADVSKRNLP